MNRKLFYSFCSSLIVLAASLEAASKGREPLSTKFYKPAAPMHPVEEMDQAPFAEEGGEEQDLKVLSESIPLSMEETHPFLKALTLAYGTNPELRAKAKEQYSRAEAISRAFANWLPSAALTANRTYSRTTQQGKVQAPTILTPQIDNSKSSLLGTTGGVEIRQNIFESGKTVASTNAAENAVLSGEMSLLNDAQGILINAVKAYLDLWLSQATLDLRRASEKAFKGQLDQARARAEAGDFGATQVAEAEVKYTDSRAETLNAEAQLKTAKETYKKVIGEDPSELPLPTEASFFKGLPESAGAFKMQAVESNPSVRAAKYAELSAQSEESAALAELGPKIDLIGSAERSLSKASRGVRQNNVSGQIQLRIPLYQQGREWSDIRRTKQVAAQRKYEIVNARRTAAEAAVSRWQALVAARERIKQFNDQMKAAELRLEGTKQEAFVGERTFQDVLDAEAQLVQTRVNLVRAQRDFLVAGYEVLQVLGLLNPMTLKLPVDSYNVGKYADSIRYKLAGWGDNPDVGKGEIEQ